MSWLEKGAVAAVSVLSVIYLQFALIESTCTHSHSFIIHYSLQSRPYAATSATRTTMTTAAASWWTRHVPSGMSSTWRSVPIRVSCRPSAARPSSSWTWTISIASSVAVAGSRRSYRTVASRPTMRATSRPYAHARRMPAMQPRPDRIPSRLHGPPCWRWLSASSLCCDFEERIYHQTNSLDKLYPCFAFSCIQ